MATEVEAAVAAVTAATATAVRPKNPNKVRKRAPKACLSCRARKVRCDVSQRGRPCMNCYLDSETCVVTGRASRLRKSQRPPTTTTTTAATATATTDPTAALDAAASTVGTAAVTGPNTEADGASASFASHNTFAAEGDDVSASTQPTQPHEHQHQHQHHHQHAHNHTHSVGHGSPLSDTTSRHRTASVQGSPHGVRESVPPQLQPTQPQTQPRTQPQTQPQPQPQTRPQTRPQMQPHARLQTQSQTQQHAQPPPPPSLHEMHNSPPPMVMLDSVETGARASQQRTSHRHHQHRQHSHPKHHEHIHSHARNHSRAHAPPSRYGSVHDDRGGYVRGSNSVGAGVGAGVGTTPSWTAEPTGASLSADITYSYYPFLAVSNLSGIPPQDVNYLELQGCLRVPTRAILDEFVQQYFLHVHPLLPLFNEGDFWELYGQATHTMNTTQAATAPRMSLLVFQAVLFATCNFVSRGSIRALGFATIRTARAALYRRAKLLFDLETESSPAALAQAALLLSFWSPSTHAGTRNPNTAWLCTAIQQAKLAEAHHYASLSATDARRANGLKRLWWCCILRDRVMGLGVRRSIQITRAHFDLEANAPLTRADLADEIERSRVYNPGTKSCLIEILVHMVELCVVLTDILALVFPQDDAPGWGRQMADADAGRVRQCKIDLRRWYKDVALKFPVFGGAAGAGSAPRGVARLAAAGRAFDHDSVILYTNLMYMYYHSSRVALCHHEILHTAVARAAPGLARLDDSGAVSVIYANRYELQDAASGVTECLKELIQLRLARWLPISAVACTALPLFLHILDVKLSAAAASASASVPASSTASAATAAAAAAGHSPSDAGSTTSSSSTGSSHHHHGDASASASSALKQHRLNILIEAMKTYQPQYDGVDWVSETIRHIVNLAQIDGPGSKDNSRNSGSSGSTASHAHGHNDHAASNGPAPGISDWTDILAANPSWYLRLAMTMDLALSKNRMPEERDFPVGLRGLFTGGGILGGARPLRLGYGKEGSQGGQTAHSDHAGHGIHNGRGGPYATASVPAPCPMENVVSTGPAAMPTTTPVSTVVSPPVAVSASASVSAPAPMPTMVPAMDDAPATTMAGNGLMLNGGTSNKTTATAAPEITGDYAAPFVLAPHHLAMSMGMAMGMDMPMDMDMDMDLDMDPMGMGMNMGMGGMGGLGGMGGMGGIGGIGGMGSMGGLGGIGMNMGMGGGISSMGMDMAAPNNSTAAAGADAFSVPLVTPGVVTQLPSSDSATSPGMSVGAGSDDAMPSPRTAMAAVAAAAAATTAAADGTTTAMEGIAASDNTPQASSAPSAVGAAALSKSVGASTSANASASARPADGDEWIEPQWDDDGPELREGDRDTARALLEAMGDS